MKFSELASALKTKKMKGVNVLSTNDFYKAINQGEIANNSLVISIINPREKTPLLENINFRHMAVRFNDTEDELGMSRMQAKLIASFVENNSIFRRPIIINCESGISSSAGVAAAVMLFLGEDDMRIFKDKQYKPNLRCFKFVCEALKISLTNDEISIRTR